jgi:hypothetical protein
VLVRHHDHELSRPGGLRHQPVAHFEQVGDVGEVFSPDDFEL